MLDALADYERLCERAVRERGLAVGEVRLAPDLGGVRFAPGVLAVGRPSPDRAPRKHALAKLMITHGVGVTAFSAAEVHPPNLAHGHGEMR